jgi:pyruvate dehydrogenase E1 component alpha subunit
MADTATRKPRGKGAKEPALSKDELLKAYRDMLLIRRFEEKAGQLYGMGLIGGFCHLYIGQEAIVVGMQACLEPGDEVITSYRDHGHMLATGMEARGVMAELTGRSGATPRARAAPCTCSAARRASTAATASSARRWRWAPASPSPTGTARAATCP